MITLIFFAGHLDINISVIDMINVIVGFVSMVIIIIVRVVGLTHCTVRFWM